MTSKTAIRTILIGSAISLCLVSARAEDAAPNSAAPSPAALIDALNGVFGKHAGTRAAHAKGFCMTGTFTPSPDAAKLSKAPHFAKQVPITARFSLGGGDPQAADNDQGNVRGSAIFSRLRMDMVLYPVVTCRGAGVFPRPLEQAAPSITGASNEPIRIKVALVGAADLSRRAYIDAEP